MDKVEVILFIQIFLCFIHSTIDLVIKNILVH